MPPFWNPFVHEAPIVLCLDFPLRYGNKIFKTALEVMSESAPDVEDLDQWHELFEIRNL